MEAIEVEQKPDNDQSIALEAGKFCLDIAKSWCLAVSYWPVLCNKALSLTHCS